MLRRRPLIAWRRLVLRRRPKLPMRRRRPKLRRPVSRRRPQLPVLQRRPLPWERPTPPGVWRRHAPKRRPKPREATVAEELAALEADLAETTLPGEEPAASTVEPLGTGFEAVSGR